jgi:type II secretory pathway predicted ATPase ExeA
MYRTFYEILYNPFDKESSIAEFETEDYKELTNRFKYLLTAKGLGVFTGKSGTGKTYTIKKFVDHLNDKRYKFIYVHSTSLTNLEFYRALCYGFNIEVSHRKVDMFNRLREEITRLFKDARVAPILIIDEAQYLNGEIMKDLALMLNYEYDSKNYLTIALLGTESLSTSLSRGVYESVKQRITINYEMRGLTKEEFINYVTSSLEKVKCNRELFESSVITNIYNNSGGILRVANRYLTLCLVNGFLKKEKIINNDILKIVFDDVKVE